MKRLELIIMFWAIIISLYAQDIEVKKFEPLEKDQMAVTSPRKDINGIACGLVKVALDEPGAEFEGNIIGDVQFTGKEYLVYMTGGDVPAKRLGIKHPDYLPTTVVFADYGIKKVVSSTTYELKVKANKKKAKVDNSKKGMAVFNIKPSNAILLIDGQIADGSGGAYTLSLPYGTHYYTVKLKDFSINNQMVKIDKNAKTINVDLTEFFAKVSINCPTEDAELTINGEQKGVGRWEGMMIPGKYTIEASKDGCHSQTRQIELKDNDEVAVDFTKLKTITGGLRVDYEPKGSNVLLDGKKVGVTPLVLKELPDGNYQLEIWKEYYVKKFVNVKIREDQEWRESGNLKLTQFGEMIVNAEKGEEHPLSAGYQNSSFCALAEYYREGAAFGHHGFPYTCSSDTFQVSLNPVKGVYWLRQAVRMGDTSVSEDIYSRMNMISDDSELSFILAEEAKEEREKYCDYDEDFMYLSEAANFYLPYAALAWHYFYGVGCVKDKEKAKSMMRHACTKEGVYWYPAFIQLVKEMNLDSELKYNPDIY